MLKPILAFFALILGLGASNVPMVAKTPISSVIAKNSQQMPILEATGQINIPEIATSIEIPSILDRIAFCESGSKQFNSDGSVVRGKTNYLDVGKLQINLFYHGTEAENMDMNLFTEEGNTAYALYLFNKNGFKDWENSRSCWGKYVKIEE